MHDSKYCDLSGLLTFASAPLTCFDSAGVWVLFHQQVTMCLLSFNLQGQGLHLGRKHPRGLLAFSCRCQCPLGSPAPTALHCPGLKELQSSLQGFTGPPPGTQVGPSRCFGLQNLHQATSSAATQESGEPGARFCTPSCLRPSLRKQPEARVTGLC